MKAPIQGHESREFNRMYKEVDELYHEVALKSGLSDTSFLVLFSIVELGDGCLQKDICYEAFANKQTVNSSIRKLEREGYLYLKHGPIFYQQANDQLISQSLRTKRLSLFKAWEKA